MYEDRIKWINHKGKRILSMDFSNMENRQAIDMAECLDDVILKEPPSSILSIGIYENVHFDLNFINAMSKATKNHTKYMKAGAVLGIKGLAKVMYDAVAKVLKHEIRTFTDKNQALDWLASI